MEHFSQFIIFNTILEEVELIKKDIKHKVDIIKVSENTYNLILRKDMHQDQLGKLQKELEELCQICPELDQEKASLFCDNRLFHNKYHVIDEIPQISEELRSLFKINILKEIPNDGMFNLQTYNENQRNIVALRQERINISDLETKIKQLEWDANKQQIMMQTQQKENLDRTIEQYRKIYTRIKKVEKILECQKSAKKRYMEDVAKYLEIPLYIYSGKLMQTSQNEMGITCYTGDSEDALTALKLVSGENNEKVKLDITEKFSSGQRAVANIALILALKKIGVTNLDVFMIDDPCQTLDELNIASFVEIMKNEFQDTQIILSTHEDKIAAYIMYKFKKVHKNMEMFNVHKRLYDVVE